MHPLKKFGLQLVVSSVFLSCMIYTITYICDPLGLNFKFVSKQFNAIKPVAVGFERQLKPLRIHQVQPKTIILGNSRIAYGIRAKDAHGFPFPVYNAAFEFAQPYEMLKILEYSITQTHLENVILFLDYGTFANKRGVKNFPRKIQ